MAAKKITDEALVAFAQWCRGNDPALVTDPKILRRVYDAYRLLPPVQTEEIWVCNCGRTASARTPGWRYTDGAWCPEHVWLA